MTATRSARTPMPRPINAVVAQAIEVYRVALRREREMRLEIQRVRNMGSSTQIDRSTQVYEEAKNELIQKRKELDAILLDD